MSEPLLAEVLLELARRDRRAFHRLASDAEIDDSLVGFHAQQTVEKALKAVLSYSGVAYRRTHDIAELLDLILDSCLATPPYADRLDELNPYAVEYRYGLIEPTGLDRAETERMLSEVLDWASRCVSSHRSASENLPMRISEQQRKLAQEKLREHYGAGAHVWLFGSRADDRRRGGDVDLYVEAEQEPATGRVATEIATAVALEAVFDGLSVDLLVRYPGDAERPIHRIAKRLGVAL